MGRNTLLTRALAMLLVTGTAWIPLAGLAESPADRPAWRLLVNDDGTNLFWREDLTPEAVQFQAGAIPRAVTTVLVCPNGIQKMLYPSSVEAVSERGRLRQYFAEGRDLFGEYLAALRHRGFEVFITFRMNEVHNAHDPNEPDLSDLWRNHPEWRVEPGAPLTDWMAQCLDYARPEVQEHALKLIFELLDRYQPDGIELDWMRFPRHLSGDERQVWRNKGMLTDVVAAVRLRARELEAAWERPVRVAVRVPASVEGCRKLGVDLSDWTARDLVDFVTASPFLASDFTMPLGALRALMGDHPVPLYAGIEFGYGGKDHTEASFRGVALGLLASGADGLYVFNFPCWREQLPVPPWSRVAILGRPETLARGPVTLALVNGTHRTPVDLPVLLPRRIDPGETVTLAWTVPAVLAAGGWETPPVLALTPSATTIEARWNDQPCAPDGSLPEGALREGENALTLRNTGSEPVEITLAELTFRFPRWPRYKPGSRDDATLAVTLDPPGPDEGRTAQARALDQLNEALRKSPGQPACLVFPAGRYALNPDWLAAVAALPHGGCALRAADPGSTILDGGTALTGWRQREDGRWESDPVPGTRGDEILYLNGEPMRLASMPFPESWDTWGDLEHIDGRCGYRVSATQLPRFARPGRLLVDGVKEWAHMVCPVAAILADGQGNHLIEMAQPWFFLALRKEGVRLEQPLRLLNAPELVDEPGEFCFDPDREVYLLIPPPGVRPDDPATVTRISGPGVRLRGASRLRFEGLVFEHIRSDQSLLEAHIDAQANFRARQDNLFARDGTLTSLHNEYARLDGGFVLEGCRDVTFYQCVFRNFDGTGLDCTGGSRGIVVDTCRFEQIGGTGIQIGGVTQADHHPAIPNGNTGDVTITRSAIRDCGRFYLGSVGLFAGYVDNVTIADNTFSDLPYSGISMGWGWGEEDADGGHYDVPYRYATATPAGANRIEGNRFSRIMARMNDGGAIYTLGAMPGTILQENQVDTSTGWPGGIYLDEGSAYIEARGNVIRNVPKPFNLNNLHQGRQKTCLFVDNDPPVELP
ncbi:MAG TPA: right-handed parallel beta-helix repeat-containing protein [Candidatus Hydrogenedentes bacterium]|nr:right-handed parallel beta-helix repeat-containing protein [Candidatus Hydrogenedentota bacterium]